MGIQLSKEKYPNIGRLSAVITAVVIIAFLRPVFYGDSQAIARGSDMAVLVMAALCILIRFKVPKKIFSLLFFIALYFLVISTSLLGAQMSGVPHGPLDFVEIFRPLIWSIFLILGAIWVQNDSDGSREKKLLIFLQLAILSSILGWLMLLFPEFMKPVYRMYNVPNLFAHGRPGGIAYTHTEFVAINVLGIASLLLIKKRLKARDKIFILFLTVSSIIPQSKGGILFVLLFFVFYWSLTINRRSLVNFLFFLLLLPIFLPLIVQLARTEYPYIFYGFSALFDLIAAGQTTDGSIGPRFLDWVAAFESLNSSVRQLLIGSSPMRLFPEVSYIENTASNILFRWGLLGFLSYYGMFVALICLVEQKQKKVFTALLLALFIADCTGNFSESIKFMMGLAIFFGAALNKTGKEENVYDYRG